MVTKKSKAQSAKNKSAKNKSAKKKTASKSSGKKAGKKKAVTKDKQASAKKKSDSKPKKKSGKSSKAASKSKNEKDDLTRIEGIGPKIRDILAEKRIKTFKKLASTKAKRLQTILAEAGPRFKGRDASTWAEQAQLAADGKWDRLKKLQAKLDGGRR